MTSAYIQLHTRTSELTGRFSDSHDYILVTRTGEAPVEDEHTHQYYTYNTITPPIVADERSAQTATRSVAYTRIPIDTSLPPMHRTRFAHYGPWMPCSNTHHGHYAWTLTSLSTFVIFMNIFTLDSYCTIRTRTLSDFNVVHTFGVYGQDVFIYDRTHHFCGPSWCVALANSKDQVR